MTASPSQSPFSPPAGPARPRPRLATLDGGNPGAAMVLGEDIVVAGEIDLTNVDALRRALTKATRRGAGFTVDLTGVRYLDSAGVRVLLEFVDSAPRVLVTEGSIIERVLAATGLPALVTVLPVPPTT